MMDLDLPLVGVVYGMLIVVFGSYVVMNLILAVIIDTFIQIHEEELASEGKKTLLIVVPEADVNLERFEELENEVIQHQDSND